MKQVFHELLRHLLSDITPEVPQGFPGGILPRVLGLFRNSFERSVCFFFFLIIRSNSSSKHAGRPVSEFIKIFRCIFRVFLLQFLRKFSLFLDLIFFSRASFALYSRFFWKCIKLFLYEVLLLFFWSLGICLFLEINLTIFYGIILITIFP